VIEVRSLGDEVEVVSLQADEPRMGLGRALMDAANAIRFYQRWGMDLAALHRDGVTRARRLKPSIPAAGNDGIPIRHELELEVQLGV